MPDYLADVVMPTSNGSEESIIPAPSEGLPAAVREQQAEQQETIQYDEEEQEEEEEEIIPEPVVKKKLTQKQVFTPLKVLPIKPEVEEDLPPIALEKPVKKTRAKRGPATPEQLERLKIGREKAAENRRKKAEANKAEKDEDNLLKEKVKVVRRRKLIKEIEEDPGETELVSKKNSAYSQEQLDEAVSKAVEKTEFLRKERKEAKKKAQEKANHDAQVFKSINSAIKPSGWDHCFS